MKTNRRVFVAGSLLGALAGNMKAYAGDVRSPPTSGDYKVIQSFRDGIAPPFSKGTVKKGGALFFKTQKALDDYGDGSSQTQLMEKGDLVVVPAGREIILLDNFAEFRGRAHVDGIGDGYVILNGEF
ncbi:hypothetical protein RsS62_65660 [Rhizobium dioscoreae]|uniref:hypothetical protein n=1 Tax=Rhizobium dioscoreae TaxID=2653122 RepID=UPI0012605FF8|nr:hypothetical protein [Rhizobium dioscoreae]GES47314.1 hypothetical protein RsS62_65660 [Rhizobium dioscoreae]